MCVKAWGKCWESFSVLSPIKPRIHDRASAASLLWGPTIYVPKCGIIGGHHIHSWLLRNLNPRPSACSAGSVLSTKPFLPVPDISNSADFFFFFFYNKELFMGYKILRQVTLFYWHTVRSSLRSQIYGILRRMLRRSNVLLTRSS